jgi:hypothetical protein
MTTEEAIKIVKELTTASIAHYRAVNEPSRKTPKKACEAETKAIWKVLTALTDAPITQADVEKVME